MVVFSEDWRYYPDAIVDTKTNNKSFVRMASLLRDMGVKHYYFMLALHNPLLQGLSPYDDNLTMEQKAWMLEECDANPWYYLREVVIDPGGGIEIDDMRFQANRANIAALWLMLACIDYLQIQPRQTGKSFGADANNLWLLYFKYRDTAINLITKDETLRKNNIERLKKLRDAWPAFLCRNTKKDDNNQISLSCKRLNNRYYTHVSQSSEKAANNLGRGLTSPLIQIDEGPFINHIATTISSAMGSMNTAREIAQRKNAPYCTIFTTTAGNQEDRDGRFVYDMFQSAAPWSEMFYDCANREELVKLIRTNSTGRSITVNLTMSALQVGKSEKWLYEAIANARSEGANVDRDYFNRWTSSSTTSVLPEHIASVVRKSQMYPIDHYVSKDSYIFRWYEAVDPSKMYILTVDTSNAIGRDDIAITAIDTETGGVTGAAAFNETNLIMFAKWLCQMMVEYPNFILVIENQFNAQTIIDYLLLTLPKYGINPFFRIFNQIVQNREDRIKDYNVIHTSSTSALSAAYDKYRQDFGFRTNAETRKLLFGNVLINAAKSAGDKVRDDKLINQMLNLVVKNDRIDHKSGGHDDMVVSWLMGQWFLMRGLNLSDYGIDPTRVLSLKTDLGHTPTPKEMYERQQQMMYREKVERLKDELLETSDIMVITRLEREIELTLDKIKVGDDKNETLSAILDEARKARLEARKRGGMVRGRGTGELLKRYG